MVKRQKIHQGAEVELLGALCDRGQEHPGRWRDTQGRRMVFSNVIAIETGPVICLDQLQPLLIEPVQRRLPAIHMVEYTKFHDGCSTCIPAPSHLPAKATNG